jgi:hypothetical protein
MLPKKLNFSKAKIKNITITQVTSIVIEVVMIVVMSSSGGSSGGSACNYSCCRISSSGCRESYSCVACLVFELFLW